MALVLLVVISLLTVMSLRNAVSTESVAGAARTSELAMQSAEIALKHCELSVASVVAVSAGGEATYPTTFTFDHIVSTDSLGAWEVVDVWDSTFFPLIYVLPIELVNQPGTRVTYQRPPECMVTPLPVMLEGASVPSTTAAFVVTARGFGPEVPPADANRSRPVGSEVWLQSHIELQ